ncbi:MAG: hypothetical protein L0Y56_22925 [Nitrospira sp.]|nr:hypothetical protein [Nitrospira sp.]
MEEPIYRADPKAYISPELIVYGNIETITQGNAGNTYNDGVFFNGANITQQLPVVPNGSTNICWGHSCPP